MRFVLLSARKDVVRRLRDPAALAIWIGIPFVILALQTMAFGTGLGSGSTTFHAQVLIVDNDDSIVSRFFAGAFTQGPLAEMIQLEKVDDEVDAKRRINRGEGTALLVIPAGFGEALLRSKPAELALWTNPSQRILPGIVEETTSVLVDGTFYLQQLFAEPLEQIAAALEAEGMELLQVTSMSTQIYGLVERVQTHLSPLAIELTHEVVSEDKGSQPDLGFGNLFFPGMFFMAIFFVAQGMSDDIWQEKKNGTLHRALRVHRGVSGLLLGKLVAGGALITTICMLSLFAGVFLFEISAARLPLALLWSVASGCALLALFTLLQVLARTQRAAVIVGNLVMFPLLILGGSMFPTEAMPAALAAIGRWTPNGWALAHLKRVFSGAAAFSQTAVALAVIALMIAVLTWLTRRRLSGSFAGTA
jgi:ABC-2 type transport system permease protein